MKEKISVLVVDDHAFSRQAIHVLLSSHHQMEVAGYAVNALEAIEMARRIRPDLVLMDLPLPGSSYRAIQGIMRQNPSMRILVFADFWEYERVLAAVASGAMGYLRKDRPEQLINAIEKVYNREFFMDSTIGTVLTFWPSSSGDGGANAHRLDGDGSHLQYGLMRSPHRKARPKQKGRRYGQWKGVASYYRPSSRGSSLLPL